MSELTLHRGTDGAGPPALRAGRDLVLDPGWADCIALANGVALDDHLAPADRAAIDAAAREALAAWRAAHGAALTIGGLDLTDVCEVELLAGCFVPAERLARALPAALAAFATSALRVDGLDRATTDIIVSVARDAGIERASTPPQTAAAAPARRSMTALALAALRLGGLPPRARGRVVCVPYWHLDAVYARLAASGGALAPMPARIALASLGARRALAVAARGGWVGVPGGRALRHAERVVGERVAALDGGDPVHRAALAVIRRDGPGALAGLQQAQAALHGGRARVLCLPWDSPAQARVLLHAMRDAGGTSLVVQHGFDAALGDPDKLSADHVAVWSRQDAAGLAAHGRVPGSVTVTGNPGAAHLAGDRPRAPRRDRTVVLVDYPSRLSTLVDARVSARHVQTALAGVAAAQPGGEVVLRPHPADPGEALYGALGARITGLRVTVDTATAIEPLLATADLCVGAMSTATLQAAALGVPTVLLDVTEVARPWPFDGARDALPRATDAAGLADAAVAARGCPDVAGADAAREALGARGGAIDDVVALIARLSADAG